MSTKEKNMLPPAPISAKRKHVLDGKKAKKMEQTSSQVRKVSRKRLKTVAVRVNTKM